ncbi:hypothetical protein S7711_10346 [Stachybotrys chartarum IBT 7711]|uniref:Uncharacterized protein n=1 Tax=Stachybotrys chartarum (strain CBS 109288 / IBT 7711) TaxID=1280523 RepID=A0A084B3R4_STACB|nr:hypothetical protein S7711_10346 [Stachybotrys chartarum IBT 7711]KFA52339.1 hypothetical protein S40293_10407 [Stachybotrys chartarum IBT 40293]
MACLPAAVIDVRDAVGAAYEFNLFNNYCSITCLCLVLFRHARIEALVPRGTIGSSDVEEALQLAADLLVAKSAKICLSLEPPERAPTWASSTAEMAQVSGEPRPGLHWPGPSSAKFVALQGREVNSRSHYRAMVHLGQAGLPSVAASGCMAGLEAHASGPAMERWTAPVAR